MGQSLPARLLGDLFRAINRVIVWHRLPFLLAVINLVALRINLRRFNLWDSTPEGYPPAPPPEGYFDVRGARTPDGTYNDLGTPAMGSTGTRFGHNVPLDQTYGETGDRLLTPNPRLVSKALMAREEFVPATILNVLAAAWIQYMVHDWFSHGKNDASNLIRVPRPDCPGRPPEACDDWGEGEMTVTRTSADPTRRPEDADKPATFVNVETHWWDGSQLYGSSAERIRQIRRGGGKGRPAPNGKIMLTRDGRLPLDSDGVELSGVNGNWWIGLSTLHTLFAKEHNAICDRLRIDYPKESDDWIFEKARLINAALMAKIHTVEWTPALLGTPELRFGMRGNWWGIAGEDTYLCAGRLSDSDIVSGIPGSPTDHHTAPYAITEEFVAVYRMHSLMPDSFSFRAVADDRQIEERDLTAVAGRASHEIYETASMEDVLYSLGTRHPGALVLHNFPQLLRRLKKQADGRTVDLASIDILRDRERGVPRYNQFRRLLDMKPFGSIDQITSNKVWAKQLNEIYDGDVEAVDLQIGMVAEDLPEGFAFSDTAFRVFILMASRRLKSDRFFTSDYTPAVYTQAGMDWIDQNGMKSVLLRHHPELKPVMTGVRNAFAPWRLATEQI